MYILIPSACCRRKEWGSLASPRPFMRKYLYCLGTLANQADLPLLPDVTKRWSIQLSLVFQEFGLMKFLRRIDVDKRMKLRVNLRYLVYLHFPNFHRREPGYQTPLVRP